MTTSDQDQDQDRQQEQEQDHGPGESPAAIPVAVPAATAGDDVPEEAAAGRLTPRQARRLRIVLSSVGMAAMGVVLALRIASRSSVLVVGVYGLALILCGVVIELSRNGRTRLGSWLLGVGLVAAVGADWLLIP
uniref:Cytochrome d ubiquinol oxidase subunit II n=1 Tax=Streptomyces sp. NBC_00148 TaxID=2903626 RepID=A0AAU1M224_9ACTN